MSPRSRRSTTSITPERRNRWTRRRALNVVALLTLVLVPLQGSVLSATQPAVPETERVALDSASAGATRGAAITPKVFLTLKKNRVTTDQRARAKVALSVGSGWVKVVAKSEDKRRTVRARLVDGKATVTLPRLPKGVYRVRALFLGNKRLTKAKSAYKSLRVGAPEGGGGGTSEFPNESNTEVPPAPAGGGGGTSEFPNESNTGVPPGTTLTPYTGSSTITEANTVIEGKTMGCIRVTAPGVVIRKSKISCSGSAVSSFDGDYSGAPLLLEDVEIDCKDGLGTAVGEALFTVRRADIHGCENGFDMNQSIIVEDSYIHGLYNGGDAHMDGIQLASGHWNGSGYSPGARNITIRHNTIYGVDPSGALGTSAIITNPSGDRNVLIEGNLLGGGAYTLYCNRPGSGTDLRVVGNHFTKRFSSRYGAFGPSDDCGDETQSGNVDHESGAPVRLD
jgi:hypothetical protein